MYMTSEKSISKVYRKETIEKKYTIVLSEVDRRNMYEHIKNSTYLAVDTETSGLNVRKEKVIGFSISGEKGIAFYYPLFEYKHGKLLSIVDNMSAAEKYLKLLSKKELLMWNASFDIRMIKNNFGVDLLPALMAEGYLLKHTIDEEGDFSLKKVGIKLQKEIGLNVEEEANKEQIELKENIKANGGSTNKDNFEIYKADLDILGKYACADADLTLRICEYYNEKLYEEGLDEFFYEQEVMPLYKEVTIPMEERGVKLDMALLESSKKEIEIDLELLKNKVISSLLDIDDVQRWLEEKALKSFPIKPSGLFAQRFIEKRNINLPKTKAGKYSITKKNIEMIEPGIGRAFLEGQDFPDQEARILGLYDISKELWKEKEGDYINIYSKKQMGEIVFDYLGVSPLSETEKGNPQFNDEMVDALIVDGHTWAKDLKDYNRLMKIKSAYIDRFLERQEDGYYFFSYKQHGTISGRYGSDAQQLPRPLEDGQESEVVLKYNNRIRKFFIADSGRKFIDCDYESLEPHVFAHVSNDEGLRDIFRKGHDFYSTIAIATEGLYEYSADKKADNYLGKLAKDKRQQAKTYALGIAYGMGGYALGKNLGIATDEAEMLVENYLSAYPKLKKWMEDSKALAQNYGYVKSQAGRVRHLPNVKKYYKMFGDKLMDFFYRKKMENKFGKQFIMMAYMDYKNGVNNSYNFQIQSLSASIVNRAAIAINREFKRQNINAHVCAQIHDQLIFDIPADKEKECLEIVKDKMENTTKLSLPLRAPPVVAVNWKDGH